MLLRPQYAGARLPPLFQTIAKAESPLSFLETKRPTGAYKRYSRYHVKTGCDEKRRIVEIKRPFFLDRHSNPRIYAAHVEFSAMGEGRVLLCGIAFALLPIYAFLRALQPPYRSHRRGT